MDRYGDYISCNVHRFKKILKKLKVVSPVKEIVGQLLGQMINQMSDDNLNKIIEIYIKIYEMNKEFENGWQMVHSLLIAIKYTIHVYKNRQDEFCKRLIEIIDYFFQISFGNDETMMIDDVVSEICTIWLSILDSENETKYIETNRMMEMIIFIIDGSDELDESYSSYEKLIELVVCLMNLIFKQLLFDSSQLGIINMNLTKILRFLYSRSLSTSKIIEKLVIKGTTDILCYKMMYIKDNNIIIDFWCHIYYLLYMGITTNEKDIFILMIEQALDKINKCIKEFNVCFENIKEISIIMTKEIFELITTPLKVQCKCLQSLNSRVGIDFFPSLSLSLLLQDEKLDGSEKYYVGGYSGPYNVNQLNCILNQRIKCTEIFIKVLMIIFDQNNYEGELFKTINEIVDNYLMSDNTAKQFISCYFTYYMTKNQFNYGQFDDILHNIEKYFSKAVSESYFINSNEGSILLTDLNESITKFSNIFLKNTNYDTLPIVTNLTTLKQIKTYFNTINTNLLDLLREKTLKTTNIEIGEIENYCLNIITKINQLEKMRYINYTRIQLYIVMYLINIRKNNKLNLNLSWYIIPLMDAYKYEDNVEIISNSINSIILLIKYQEENKIKNPIAKIFQNICLYIQTSYITNIPIFLNEKILIDMNKSNETIIEINNENGIYAIGYYHQFIMNDPSIKIDFPISLNFDLVKNEFKLVLKNSSNVINEFITSFYDDLIFINCIEENIFSPILKFTFSNFSDIETCKNEIKKCYNALLLFQICYESLKIKFNKKCQQCIEYISFSLLSCKFTIIRTLCAYILSKIFTSLEPISAINYIHSIIDNIDNDNLYLIYGKSELVFYILYTNDVNDLNDLNNLNINIQFIILSLFVHVIKNLMNLNSQVAYLYSISLSRLMQFVPILINTYSQFNCNDFDNKVKNIIDEAFKFISELSMPLSNNKIQNLCFDIPVNLRPYQIDGINWLLFLQKYNLNGALCDDMGLGKTLQTIITIALTHYQHNNLDSKKATSLIICPSILVCHWADEFVKFLPKNMFDILKFTDNNNIKNLEKNYDIIIVSYHTMKNFIDKFKNIVFKYIVLDEAHIVKNKSGKLFSCVKMLKSNFKIILTGTPIQNNVVELWTLFDFLMPNFLNSFQLFSKQYAKPIAKSFNPKCNSDTFIHGQKLLNNLHKQVLPFILRRTKNGVLKDLPEKIIQTIYCDLSQIQQLLYDSIIQKENINDLSFDLNLCETKNPHIFQTISFLKRICNHPLLLNNNCDNENIKTILEKNSKKIKNDINSSTKSVALLQLLEDLGIYTPTLNNSNYSSNQFSNQSNIEIDNFQHRALIFAQTISTLDIIENTLLKKFMPNVKYLRVDGSVPLSNRYPITQEFNNNTEISLLLLTTSVGSLGLNLVGADVVIFYDHDWNPMKDLQVIFSHFYFSYLISYFLFLISYFLFLISNF